MHFDFYISPHQATIYIQLTKKRPTESKGMTSDTKLWLVNKA